MYWEVFVRWEGVGGVGLEYRGEVRWGGVHGVGNSNGPSRGALRRGSHLTSLLVYLLFPSEKLAAWALFIVDGYISG